MSYCNEGNIEYYSQILKDLSNKLCPIERKMKELSLNISRKEMELNGSTSASAHISIRNDIEKIIKEVSGLQLSIAMIEADRKRVEDAINYM